MKTSTQKFSIQRSLAKHCFNRMKIKYFATAACISLISQGSFASGLCEAWSVTATPSCGITNAKWNFTAGTDPGYMTGTGSSTGSCGTPSYALAAYILDTGQVSVQRTNSTDGNDCTYTGIKNGNTVSGTYNCTNGGKNIDWSAIISVCGKDKK